MDREGREEAVDQPSGIVVRPSPAQLRRRLLIATPAVALTALPLAADDVGTKLLGGVGILVLVPLIAAVVMHFRNKRLAQRGENLLYVDWRGREQLIPASDIAVAGFVTVVNPGGGPPDERLVIQRFSGAAPLVVGVSVWDRLEIRRLLRELGLAVEAADHPVTRHQLMAFVPGIQLPWWERHPFLVALAVLAAVFVVVVVVVAATS